MTAVTVIVRSATLLFAFPSLAVKLKREQALAALGGQGPLATALIWNAGAYLWYGGVCQDLAAGVARATDLVQSGALLDQLRALIQWRHDAS